MTRDKTIKGGDESFYTLFSEVDAGKQEDICRTWHAGHGSVSRSRTHGYYKVHIGTYHQLFHFECLIEGKEDDNNNYAHGYYTVHK